MAGQSIALTQVSELTKFPPERTFVCSRHTVSSLRAFGSPGTRILECGCTCVVIDKVSRAFLGESYLPSRR